MKEYKIGEALQIVATVYGIDVDGRVYFTLKGSIEKITTPREHIHALDGGADFKAGQKVLVDAKFAGLDKFDFPHVSFAGNLGCFYIRDAEDMHPAA